MTDIDEIEQAVALAEAETGVRGGGAKIRLCLATNKQRRRLCWTEKEEAYLRENYGRISEEEIAAHLGRTLASLDNHIKREMHLVAPSKDPRILTAEHIAMGLGMDGKSVHRLIDTGRMPGRRLPGNDVTRVVDRMALLLWISEPLHWIYFKTDRVGAMRTRGKRGGMTDVYDFEFWEDAREVVDYAREQWKDEWLTPGQASRIIGINPALKAHNVNRAIHVGNLPAVRWGNWWIRRSDLPAPEMTINVLGRIVPKVKPKYVCPRGMAHNYLSTCMKLQFCRELINVKRRP